ncbi:replication factor A protein 3 [Emericellopsis atlantica]|uniref:Replication factor A protein 3 n=1 Tax=Emericellopsis atlantica TaxID=2614577 RepID=A0A9P7ZIZ5_9HYPO|nr:replication factor A protein 3 [Emericellopsis atlantica]KAG9252880.1 replication factor A protein 3 [Emericellopsis atlantica]
MSDQIEAPRVTARLLDNFIGRHVRIVGQVIELRGDQAVINSDGAVTILLNRDAHLSQNGGAQIIGKVNPDLSIKALNSVNLGDNVDYKLYGMVVEVTHKFPQIFLTGTSQ